MKLFTKLFLFLLLSGLFLSSTIYAQNSATDPCYFDEYTNNHSILKAESIIKSAVKARENNSASKMLNDSVKTIPIVVHVLHIGGNENISEAQIQSQIDVLNEDFRKISGSNGDGDGVDTKVNFCLAKIDPNGNCTNGIVRVFTPLANHQTYERAMLKQLSFWDNTKYMNIYVVRTIGGGVLGYSSFPGGPADEDGMVVRNNVFGTMGTASSSLGRTTSHEIGHWFGLYHTFNNGCGVDVCTDGDYVCDTPPQASPSFNCGNLNTCSNDVPDVNDQKQNYMNYTPDGCKDMFTDGQKMRIQATLDSIRTYIWSEENLIATGCDSNYVAPAVCGVSSNFVTLTQDICIGNEIVFMDISLNDATSWEWTFEGGTPATSNEANPTISYNELGSFAVTLIASDSATTDTLLVSDYITVSNPGIGIALPFYEDFDSGIFPPQDLVINNLDGGVTWGLDSAASVSGNYSVKIDNYININYGSADEIVFPYFDMTSTTLTDLTMTYEWAYARSDPSFSDEMIVLLSTDCGSNFEQIFYKSGNSLTTGPTQTTPFIPDSSQWETANISLNDYLDEQYVQIKIVNITDGGNNLYIDNINIGDISLGISSNNELSHFSFYPNPASDIITLEFSSNVEDRQLSIYNSIGKLIYLKDIGNTTKTNVSTLQLPAGLYYLEIVENNTRSMKKLIISK